jgi:hypothetical protein
MVDELVKSQNETAKLKIQVQGVANFVERGVLMYAAGNTE